MQRFSIGAPFFVAGLLLIIAACHVVASTLGWYLTVPWLAVILHFLGGLWSAALFAWLFRNELAAMFRARPLLAFFCIVGFAALIGVTWESFEFSIDRLFNTQTRLGYKMQIDLADTMQDLTLDLLGGLAAFCILWRNARRPFHAVADHHNS